MHYSDKQISEILASHRAWLKNKSTGSPADLSGADLKYKYLEEVNLSGANLSGVNLASAHLTNANLSGANLTNANLSSAKLRWANLSWANLSGANLERADLSLANLSGADLILPNLTGTKLDRVNLTGANLDRANLIVLALPYFTAYVQKTHTWIGCAYHSNADWQSFTNKEIRAMHPRALQFWRSHKKLIFAAMGSF